ncbi:MAG: transcription-repair coupling factor [Dehalococcoidia bacterium]|nr:transcription-repair coupling factor [Dehalococcoidia bacterium]
MNLSALLPALAATPPLTEVYARLEARAKVTLGLIDASKAVTAALLWRRQRAPVLLVVPREVDAEAMLDQLRAWAGDAAVHFPARGTLPYAEEGPNASVTAQRLAVLSRLAHSTSGGEPPLVVASTAAVIEHTLRPADLGRGPGVIEAGMRLPLDTLAARLVEAGYVVEPIVQEPGEAARRGGLLDVFPPDAESPIRIEWFGSEIDSIRAFDPATQRTRGQLERVVIGPAHEWFAEPADLVQLAARLDGVEGAELEEHLHALRRGELVMPARYGPLATDATLLDHLPAGALLVLDEREAVEAAASDLEELAAERREELTAQHVLTAATPLPQASRSAFEVAVDRQLPRVDLSRWATGTEPGAFRLPFQPRDAYAGRLPAAASDTLRELRRGDRVVTVTQQAQRYREVLADAEVQAGVVDAVGKPLGGGEFALVQGALPEGWQVATPQGVVSLTTDRELFGFVKRRRTLRRAGSASQRSRFLAEVAPGDFVVHADHGIARFAGIIRRAVGDEERDYLELRYAGDDRLYVPIDQVDRVTRYVGPSEHIPRLTRLGTQEWNHARARVREAVTLVAADLLRLYAARQLLHGHAFREDTPWQLEMEAAFPFEETEDQLRTIAEVKADMESPRPMDRLICGDVGFGKTEVAVRAAFKAVMDGMQVAVLVPTTVLAQQHERTFRERLAAFPVRVEMLSRFRSDHEAREIIAALKAGEIDIVIGTHRLLQPSVEFANLGLVIIDEEQRFGVAHKERLKRMRLEVDVLSLSATPIPRTLHMSLTGIRDMSSIESAPVDRHPVQTFVAEWDPALVREAILRELDRGGQIYVVHNRVQSIDLLADRLRELVPQARVVVGHGQMSEVLLERVMERFADAEYDILVCTTIIESGIDIPNVNTLIIDNADQLGLAQLYQLRGRVGRSTQQAYAYLLHSRERILSEVAQQRLATIFEATELGSGFQVALRDLEIRGAGNLLGAEQSGQIASVGFDLYTQMLAEAVEEMKAKTSTAIREEIPVAQPVAAPVRAARAVKIDLPVSAFIPESYVEEIEARLALYQRIAGLTSLPETEALRAETADRLGPLPEALEQLFALVRIRLAAGAADVASVRLEEGEVVVTSRDDRPFGPRRLPSLPRAVRVGRTQLRLPKALLGERWLDGIEALLRLVATGTAAAEREAAGVA